MTGELLDALGAPHRPADRGARIVSLVPSLTELLFDLGLGDRVVGRTSFCVHPAAALASVPRVGGTKQVRLDRLEDLAPTHVIVNVDENDRAQVEAMRAFVPNVIVTHPLGPDDNRALYALVGALFDRAGPAAALAARYDAARARLVAARGALPERRVLYLIWREPWMTVSCDTYVSRTLALAGLETAGSDDRVRYPEVDLGEAAAGADAVLLSSEPFPFKPRHHEEVAAAVGNEVPVHAIDGEMVSWYGSRAPAGLEYLARFRAALETHLAPRQRLSTGRSGSAPAGSKPKMRP